MRNSRVHLLKFFCLGKKKLRVKRRGRYFAQNQTFLDSVLSVGVLKLQLLL